ncbi:hypothetical protein SAY86_013912 [Trapa natans]|uniref:Calnexin n=1 Tax=Trapa natans TaxID=22666 RepID=A0AAN7KRS8_TRANT|nr:hypothetical protein SAY86_013912 [Trapa natans]
MMEVKLNPALLCTVTLLLIWCVAIGIQASDNVIFYEPFDESYNERWVVSGKDDYQGVWKHAKSEGHDDYGLLVSEKARKYAIVKELDDAVSLNDGTVVLQYEVRLQNGLECGGAYLKYLRPQDAGWKPEEFDNECPYLIMFGPDKCGATDKVHFIFKHKNPKSGEYVEHHLKDPPSVPSDKLSHVYTAILRSNNELRILIDGEEKNKVNFLSSVDFEPPLLPAKTITDVEDKKPEDWDDRAKIPDPDAVQPDDWDEDAPMDIEDEEAVKPKGWLDDELDEVDDPEARKPEDWNDEEDGEWEPPKIPNIKCEMAPGCGEWHRPMRRNPAYKGKWQAPLIDNPNYKGIWKAQVIPNPDYFEVDRPDFDPIAAIGIEIWTMQDGILFDNILIASDESIAESYREASWKPKFENEKLKSTKESAGSDALSALHKIVINLLYKVADIPFLEAHRTKILDLLKQAENQTIITVGLIASLIVVILTACLLIILSDKKPEKKLFDLLYKAADFPFLEAYKPKILVNVPEATGELAAEASGKQGTHEKEEEDDDDSGAAAPGRRSRRETEEQGVFTTRTVLLMAGHGGFLHTLHERQKFYGDPYPLLGRLRGSFYCKSNGQAQAAEQMWDHQISSSCR